MKARARRSIGGWSLSFALAWAGLAGAPAARGQETSFGSSSKAAGEAALIGILYDLKQTQLREKTKETTATYKNVIFEFMQADWDESVLNRYFRVTRPVYTTQLSIQSMSANHAPKAFGVEDVVEPRMWVVHYKGQVSPPEDGLYRFSGYADDIMAVRVNGRVVLVTARPDCRPPVALWNPPTGHADFTDGDWISLKAGESVDFDVLVGERPGGNFSAVLHVAKQGATFGGGKPPLFKLAAGTKNDPKLKAAPDTNWSVWSAKQ